MQNFTGFPRELPNFLFELKFSNTFDRIDENRDKYKELICAPLMKLYEAVVPTVAAFDADLVTRPLKCVSSPYTDRRFSPEVPFKEYCYLRFRLRDDDYDTLGFFFDMGLEGYDYGVRIYYQTTAGMSRIRDYCLAHREEAESALAAIDGIPILGKKYVKDHFPDETGALKDFLNMRTCRAAVEQPLSDELFNGNIAETLSAAFTKLEPFYRLLKNGLAK